MLEAKCWRQSAGKAKKLEAKVLEAKKYWRQSAGDKNAGGKKCWRQSACAGSKFKVLEAGKVLNKVLEAGKVLVRKVLEAGKVLVSKVLEVSHTNA